MMRVRVYHTCFVCLVRYLRITIGFITQHLVALSLFFHPERFLSSLCMFSLVIYKQTLCFCCILVLYKLTQEIYIKNCINIIANYSKIAGTIFGTSCVCLCVLALAQNA